MTTSEALMSLFFVSEAPIGRGLPDKRDRLGKMLAGPWRDRRRNEGQVETNDRAISPDMIERHLTDSLLQNGERAMLMPYTVDAEGFAVATAIDLDSIEGGHADKPQHFDTRDDARRACVTLHKAACEMGLVLWPETTRGGSSRAWLFHERVPASDARDLGRLLLKRTGLSSAIEVFPKQAHASVTGNGVFLPYWGGAAEGRQVITGPDTGEALTAEMFARLAWESRTPADRLTAIVAEARASGEITATKAPAPRREASDTGGAWGKLVPSLWPVQLGKCAFLRGLVEQAESGAELSYDEWAVYLPSNLRPYGEWGRQEYHRLSKFDKRYEEVETDNHWDSLDGGPSRCGKMCEKDPQKDCGLPPGKVSSSHWAYRGMALQMAAEKHGGLPVIETNGQHLREKSAGALAALTAANDPPSLFVRGGQMVRIRADENRRAAITEITVPALRANLARCANFVSTSEKRGAIPVTPPQDVVEDLLATADTAGLPPLTGIATAPVFGPDGALETRPGYHPAARLYYHQPEPLDIPDTSPTPGNVASARALLLDELLGDFPFSDEASRAHALCLLLQPFVRPMIAGVAPVYLIDAPAAGTGKGLLARACTSPFRTGGAPVHAAPREESEWEKLLCGVFAAGDSHLLLDNVRHLDSPQFLAATSATVWSGRLLGGNRIGVFDNRLCWLITANNLQSNDELLRRSVWIRMDAGVEQPDARQGFRHRDLDGWGQEHRGELIGAALTLVRAWIEAGRPVFTEQTVGGFEGWARTMGGILGAVGVPGFLANRTSMRARADTETAAWHGFVSAWKAQHGEFTVTSADLFILAQEWFPERLGDKSPQSQKTRLGRLLGSHTDRVFGGMKIVRDGQATSGASKGSPQYRLGPVNRGDVGGRGGRCPAPHVIVSDSSLLKKKENSILQEGAGNNPPHVPHVPPDDLDGPEVLL